MKVTIMQPYFFPWLGYWQLIAHADTFMAFDEVQFINKGWVNRNKILHSDPSKDWRLFTIPLKKKSRETKIVDIETHPTEPWRERILGQLTTYKKAPYYSATMGLVRECLGFREQLLSRFLVKTLRATAKHLGLGTTIHLQSELGLELGPVEHKGQWALRLAEAMGAKEYANPIGGMSLFRPEDFKDLGIDLRFLQTTEIPYKQGRKEFVPCLSILDLLMWNSVPDVVRMLQSYEILTAEQAGLLCG